MHKLLKLFIHNDDDHAEAENKISQLESQLLEQRQLWWDSIRSKIKSKKYGDRWTRWRGRIDDKNQINRTCSNCDQNMKPVFSSNSCCSLCNEKIKKSICYFCGMCKKSRCRECGDQSPLNNKILPTKYRKQDGIAILCSGLLSSEKTIMLDYVKKTYPNDIISISNTIPTRQTEDTNIAVVNKEHNLFELITSTINPTDNIAKTKRTIIIVEYNKETPGDLRSLFQSQGYVMFNLQSGRMDIPVPGVMSIPIKNNNQILSLLYQRYSKCLTQSKKNKKDKKLLHVILFLEDCKESHATTSENCMIEVAKIFHQNHDYELFKFFITDNIAISSSIRSRLGASGGKRCGIPDSKPLLIIINPLESVFYRSPQRFFSPVTILKFMSDVLLNKIDPRKVDSRPYFFNDLGVPFPKKKTDMSVQQRSWKCIVCEIVFMTEGEIRQHELEDIHIKRSKQRNAPPEQPSPKRPQIPVREGALLFTKLSDYNVRRGSSSSETDILAESVTSKELRAKGFQRPSYLSLPEVVSEFGAEGGRAPNSPVSPLAKLQTSHSVFYTSPVEGEITLLAPSSRGSLELTGLNRAVSAPNLRGSHRPRTNNIAKAKNTRELKEALHSLGSQVREDLKNVSSGNLRAIGNDVSSRSRSNSILDQLRQLEDLKQLVATREEEILECVAMGESLLNETHSKDVIIQSQSDQITALQKEVAGLSSEVGRIARDDTKHANKVAIDMAREELSDAKEALRNQEEILEREKEDMQWCRRQTLQQASEQVAMELKIHALSDQNIIISLETREAQARLLLVQSSLVEYNDIFENSLCYAYRVVEKLEQSDLELTMTIRNITETLQKKDVQLQDDSLLLLESDNRQNIRTSYFDQFNSLSMIFFNSMRIFQSENEKRRTIESTESDQRSDLMRNIVVVSLSRTIVGITRSNNEYEAELQRLSTVISSPSDNNKLRYLTEEVKSQKEIQSQLSVIWEGEKSNLKEKISALEKYVDAQKLTLKNASESQVTKENRLTEASLKYNKLEKLFVYEQSKNSKLSESTKQISQLAESLQNKKTEIVKLNNIIDDLRQKMSSLEEKFKNEGIDSVTTQIMNRMKAMRNLEDTQLDYKRKLEAYKTSVNSLIETSEGPVPSFGSEERTTPGISLLSNGDQLQLKFQKIQSQLTALDDAVYDTQRSHKDAESEMTRTSDILRTSISQSRSQIRSVREGYSSRMLHR